MKKRNFVIVFLVLSVISFAVFSSCENKRKGYSLLCEKLCLKYDAEFDFSFSGASDAPGDMLSGSAKLCRGDICELEFLSPEPLSGMKIQTDEAGNSENIRLVYYGIKAELPKDAFSKVNMLLSAFSPSLSSYMMTAKDTSVIKKPADENNAGKESCGISFGNCAYSFTYDADTGVPESITVSNGEFELLIKITSFVSDV